MANYRGRAPGRSLRTILIVWFFLFSVVPLVFLTFYTIFKFEKAIDNEQAQRLLGNGREISTILNEYEGSLKKRRATYQNDGAFKYALSTVDATVINKLINQWLDSDFSSTLTVFDRNGKMLASAFRDENNKVRSFIPSNSNEIHLSDTNVTDLKNANQISYLELSNTKKMILVALGKVISNGKVVGFLEQTIELDSSFLKRLKDRMDLEILFLRNDGQFILGSHSDFSLYKPEIFSEFFKNPTPLLNINIRGNLFGFAFYKAKWGSTEFQIGLGSNKNQTKAVLKNVNYAFYTIVSVIVLLLVVTIFVASNIFLKPIYELLEAIQSMHGSEAAIEIPIKNDTEIGLLTAAFNEMSRKVADAQRDLKKKISELELANSEIRDTQSQLVQSAKMASLGQLVAGVAHELNNPIGFIFSNMTHLKDYSEKLIQLIELSEKNPEKLASAKEELELDFIKADLPKLVKSCEEGARRTKDIVLGLRNFSRLQEAQLKEVNLEESLDNTIDLLSGEMKNRIDLHKDFSGIPQVNCFASQINQVFMNIISNSVQAIEGNGQIWISTKPLKGPEGSYNRVAISIQDSGKGISAENLEKIFDPFFTTKGIGQGTGLGLSISYGIIQNHGGEIQVKSQLGVGTEFTIILPLKAKIN